MPPFSVIAPSPCLPFLLRARQTELEILIGGDAVDGTAASWAGGLTLRDVADNSRIRLRAHGVTQPDPATLPPHIRPAASLAQRAGNRVTLLHLQCLDPIEPRAPRRARVFDLIHGDDVARGRCVASWQPADDRLRIAFASDLHVANIWDEIAGTLQRYAPDLAPRLLHPGELVERMVADLAALAERGELDALVLGGDLVDHVYRRRGDSETNAPLLLERLATLPVPVYAIAGNHDFRLYPWRPRIYPFDAAGIPQHRARHALRRAGLWDPWPMNPRDLDAVRTPDADAPSPLAHHLTFFASASEYTVDFGDLRLIFLCSGRDILPRWRTVERGRAGMLLRSIPISYEHPDCEGFSDAQLAALREALEGCRHAALFFHAPLFNPLPGRTLGPRLDRIDPGDDDTLPARLRFERHLFRSGHRHGVFFRNAAPFVRTIASFDGALTAFSGHVHATHAIELEPKTLAVRSVAVDRAHSNGVHALLNAPALGQTATRNGEPPGYLFAEFHGGRMTSVERRHVSPRA